MNSYSVKFRPTTLDDFLGQEHFLYKDSLFYNDIKNNSFSKAIFFGPSGSGKTTLARIIANEISKNERIDFLEINASETGIKELKEKLETAKKRAESLEKTDTLIYIDEFHRFNKLQQDTLLKSLEEGTIKFIGSTTENPYFSINNAILSRISNIYEFKKLSTDNIKTILKRVLDSFDKKIKITENNLELISTLSNEDARVAIEKFCYIINNSNKNEINKEIILEAFQKKSLFFDKSEDKYNLLSALQKSIRGSDPDAGLHYLAKLIIYDADLSLITRRLLVIASEDIGLSYPQIIPIANACENSAMMVGFPEARIILADLVVLLASLPKTNKAYIAYEKAADDILSNPNIDIPDYLKDSHYKGAKKLGRGKGYINPHENNGIPKQRYLPKELLEKGVRYYIPSDIGLEKKLKEFYEFIEKNLKKK